MVKSMAREQSQRLCFGEGKPLFYYELHSSLAGSQPRLVLTIHHTLYDAWTLTMFLDDLNHQYFSPQVARRGRQPYACFIQYLANLDEPAAAAYWTKKLADTPLFQFPEVPNTHYRPQAKNFSTLKENVNLNKIKAKGISACDSDSMCMGCASFFLLQYRSCLLRARYFQEEKRPSKTLWDPQSPPSQ